MRKLLCLNLLSVSEKLSKSFFLPRHTLSPFHTLFKPNLVNSLVSPPFQWRFCGSLSRSHFKAPIKTFLASSPSRVGFLSKLKASPSSSTQHRSWSSWYRGYSADGVVYGLIIVNAAIFVLWRVLPQDLMYKHFTISVDNFKSGRIHTLLTCAFSHINLEHLGSNMIGLYFFGSSIGSAFGPEYLLKLYIAGAVVGSIFFLVHHAYLATSSKNQGTFFINPSKIRGMGASGAVNAIMLLDIFLFPKKTILFDFFIPVPAMLLGIFLVGKDVLRILEGDEEISGSAHLGGAAVAAVAWLRLRRKLWF